MSVMFLVVDLAARAKLAIAKAILRVAAEDAGGAADPDEWAKNSQVHEILERHGLDEARIAALLHDLGRAIASEPGDRSRSSRPNIGLD